VETYDDILRSELDAALALLLAPPSGNEPADSTSIAGFLDYLDSSPATWLGLRSGSPGTPTGLFFALLLPGRTAIVLVPAPDRHGIDPQAQTLVAAAGLARLAEHRLHFAQTLLEPEATAKQELLERVGFKPLAPLIYLERDAVFPWVDPPAHDDATWTTYGPEAHDEFIRVLRATYQDSLDCPELSDLRPAADAMESHRASGRFAPRFWELIRVDGQLAGCLLLAPLACAPVMEVVYMGVCPGVRRRGVGALLLRRALEQSRNADMRRLTLVVDGRNAPARRLYDAFALRPVARRNASLYVWPPHNA